MKAKIILSCLFVVGAAFAEVAVERGVAYRDVPGCVLDFKHPVGATNFATIVWYHGGGLTVGRRGFIDVGDDIAQVAVEYRLMAATNSVRAAECISDAAAAAAWALRNVAKFGGDPKKVFISGSSAGGYLTMMVGMDPKWLAEFGASPNDFAGLAPVSGQASKHFAVRKFSGDETSQFVPVVDDLAPLRWCSKDVPPICDICGEPPWEWKGRAEENRLLIASLRALGHKKAWYVELPYSNHGRTIPCGVPYVELFVRGQLPEPLENGAK